MNVRTSMYIKYYKLKYIKHTLFGYVWDCMMYYVYHVLYMYQIYHISCMLYNSPPLYSTWIVKADPAWFPWHDVTMAAGIVTHDPSCHRDIVSWPAGWPQNWPWPVDDHPPFGACTRGYVACISRSNLFNWPYDDTSDVQVLVPVSRVSPI